VSKQHMRTAAFSLVILGLSLCASAQSRSSDDNKQAVIRYVKTLLASTFDSRLPHMSLEDFLSYETGSIQGEWAIIECQNRTAPAGDDANQRCPICIQAEYDVKRTENLDVPARSLSRGGLVTILISVKTFKNGQFQGEAILNLVLTDVTGVVHQLHNLFDLPVELHRPPPRIPRDLPVPTG
jgi:hypothetical protein